MHFFKDEAGFSLIELVVAIVLLCTIIPLTTFFINSLKTNDLTDKQQTANRVAQKYMEKYKAMSFSDSNFISINDNVDTETGYHVYVTVDFAPVPELDLFAGTLEITQDPSNVDKTMFHIFSSGDFSSGGDESYKIPGSGELPVLKIIDDFGVEKLALVKSNGSVAKSIPLDVSDPASGTRAIYIVVEDNRVTTLSVENALDASVIFNIAKKAPFTLESIGGKISTVNTKKIEKYDRGANITVIIKDKDNNKELVKIAQTKKI